MLESPVADERFTLSRQDLSQVESYRKLRETSVLVILFTDIKGFTEYTERRGDAAMMEVLARHDEILVRTIEENGAGLVVKHIGDSIMAVFSEPSTAVERALKVQERLRDWNGENPGKEPIQVRIGIHMGQVAVENATRLDLFGRHVNRASRVEGLADAGQVFITYPVFDSARGWLAAEGAETIGWKYHGTYAVKGIAEGVGIWEVHDPRFTRPRPPARAHRKTSLLPLWAAVALLVVGAGITFGVLQLKRTEVWFERWPGDRTIVDQREELLFLGDPSLGQRRALTRLSPGRHVLSQDINWQVKNYMETVIHRGKNVVKPDFTGNYLPSLEARCEWEPGAAPVSRAEDFRFLLYGKDNERLSNTARVTLSAAGAPDPANRKVIDFQVSWKIELNGKTISADTLRARSELSNTEGERRDQVIYEDGLTYWFLSWYTSGNTIDASTGAAYIEYKDR
jgi:class 3 adenylate cyclase